MPNPYQENEGAGFIFVAFVIFCSSPVCLTNGHGFLFVYFASFAVKFRAQWHRRQSQQVWIDVIWDDLDSARVLIQEVARLGLVSWSLAPLTSRDSAVDERR